MKIISKIEDKKIKSQNLLVETTFGEYLSFANDLIKNNEYQRLRVKSSKSIYSLLRTDLIVGCVIPSIVLALQDCPKIDSDEDLKSFFDKQRDKILILDGLQRTYTIIDAQNDIEQLDYDKKELFNNSKLRLEIYYNINRFGILYRMLTLNAGQTPMTARHQIEMLYRDYLGKTFDNIVLKSDIDGAAKAIDNEFVFKNVIDGVNSFVSNNESPMDRQDILDNISILENISQKGIIESDVFEDYLSTYSLLFSKVRELSNNYCINEDDKYLHELPDSVFGKSVADILSTSQSMTGFGAAVSKMIERKIISGFDDIKKSIDKISNPDDIEWLFEFLRNMEKIKSSSKKIGNSQRLYFKYIYRFLFNPECDSYCNLPESIKNAYDMYNNQA